MNGTSDRPVSRAIVIQVVVVSVLALVVLAVAVTRLVQGTLGLGWAVGGLLGGAVVGVVASRMKRMKWDERTGRAISKIDWLGGVILVCFLVAQLARSWVLGHWAEGVALTTLGLCVTAGTLAGQVLGTRRAVRAVHRPGPSAHDRESLGGM
jgi:drug/metabolite transporter (DMT)-like permease